MVLPSKRPMYYRSVAILAIVAVLVIVQARSKRTAPNSLDDPQQTLQTLQGSTMGTTYSIRYRLELGGPNHPDMQRAVDDELRRVNQQMSTYVKDSEISLFNDSSSTEWYTVSAETASVVDLSLQISSISDGAFDVTVGPLVDLWGFGSDKTRNAIPSEAEIIAAKARVGYKNLAVKFDPPALKKLDPAVRIDLSAIAKGHGVDRIAGLFRTRGISNYFIEIGGEVIAQGTRVDGKPWQVGIEAPYEQQQSIQTVIGLSGAALATSGDYRNFFKSEGKRFSHTIDPNTGRPVTHELASASVVADNCALADAIATSMMVLGPQRGLQLAETKKWAVLFMQRNDGQVSSICSTGFSELYPTVCKQLTVAK